MTISFTILTVVCTAFCTLYFVLYNLLLLLRWLFVQNLMDFDVMVKTDAGLNGLYIREITIYIRLYY